MPDEVKPVAVEPKLSRFQAQIKLGLLAPHDYVTIAIILFSWVTMGFWKLFGDPSVIHLIACALLDIFLILIWMTILIYRVLIFILDLHGDIALMPESAARIAAGYFEGRMPSTATARQR